MQCFVLHYRPRAKAMTAMCCGKEASEWISKYLGTKGLHIVVSTENMAKRDVSELAPRPWLNVPETTDKVSSIQTQLLFKNIIVETLSTYLKNNNTLYI